METDAIVYAKEAVGRARAWVCTHRAASAAICAGVVLVLLVCLTAVSVNASIGRVQTCTQQLSAGYSNLKNHLSSADANAALEDAAAIENCAADLERELGGWTWSLAAVAPWTSADCTTARSLARINSRLAREVTTPLVDAFAAFAQTGIINGNGSVNLLALANNPQAAEQLVSSIRALQPAVSECNQEVQQLPEPNSNELKDATRNAKETLQTLDESFNAIDTLLSATTGIGDTIATLLP